MNNHGYGIQNSVNSHSKKQTKEVINKNQEEIDNQEIERTIDETINQIDQTQNNSSTNSDESDAEYSE